MIDYKIFIYTLLLTSYITCTYAINDGDIELVEINDNNKHNIDWGVPGPASWPGWPSPGPASSRIGFLISLDCLFIV